MKESAHLLVADGDPCICALLSSVLHKDGIVASCADNPRAALWLMQHDRFDAAFVEVLQEDIAWMPLMVGLARQRVPIILMTGVPEATAWLEARSYPYLHKPFTSAQIRAVARKAVLTGILFGFIAGGGNARSARDIARWRPDRDADL